MFPNLMAVIYKPSNRATSCHSIAAIWTPVEGNKPEGNDDVECYSLINVWGINEVEKRGD
jgi:hypothetical protein